MLHDASRWSFEPSEPRYRTVADFAYARLRERIIRGELPPGERINQDAEAGRFDVSRMPIREALRRLAAEGLVEIQPHRGTIVSPLGADDLEDIYTLRLELEDLACRLGVPRLSDEDLSHMRDLLPSMEEIVASGSMVSWLDVDWQFHSVMYEASSRSRLLRFIWRLWDEGSRYRLFRLAFPNELRVSLDVHYQILQACEIRDGEAAAKLVTDALIDSREKLIRTILRSESREAPASGAAQGKGESG